MRATVSNSWKQVLVTLPGVGVALLPKLACPACAPAYAAVLSSVGLGFLTSGPYLFPVILVGLTVALTGLGYRAERRRGYRPLVLGAIGAVVVLIAKFGLEFAGVMYVGLVVLLIASVWNSWPLRRDQLAPCAACVGEQFNR
ncbi:MAG: MerC domain-containing protein [Pirellulales bacterium]